MSYLHAGEIVYLHCSEGNGRSGVIAAVILGIVYDLGAVEALSSAWLAHFFSFRGLIFSRGGIVR